MIVDTSALVAVLKHEPERVKFAQALDEADSLKMSAATYLELSIVMDSRKSATLSREVDEIIERFSIEIEPVTVDQARIARHAYRDYGKGSGHPAQLNFGDCFSYALARDKREPMLYKGDDFVHTDIRPAVAP
jgi:ribonuclease VapC